MTVSARKPAKTVDEVFAEFLADQEVRLSPSTYRRYDDILDLFRSCLESYWPGQVRRSTVESRPRAARSAAASGRMRSPAVWASSWAISCRTR